MTFKLRPKVQIGSIQIKDWDLGGWGWKIEEEKGVFQAESSVRKHQVKEVLNNYEGRRG